MVQRIRITRRRSLQALIAAAAPFQVSPAHPDTVDAALGLWRSIRENLTDEKSAVHWRGLKDALLPGGFSGVKRFTGRLVLASPETNPLELTIAVDGSTADAKIMLIEELPGHMPSGSQIQFAGTAIEFVKAPYLLTLESDTVDIEGWTGK